MAENPFNPPQSNISDMSKNEKKGSLWIGILVGGAVDIGGTSILGIIMFVIYLFTNISQTITPEEIMGITEGFTHDVASLDSIYGILSYIIGITFSLIGGYVCAHFAREHWKLAVLILAALISIFGVLMAIGYYPIGRNLVLGFLTFIVILLGGWLNYIRRKKEPV